MDNIFENAYFGKAYKTRDGRKAIYAGKLPSTNLHRLLVEDTLDTFNYDEFGSFKPHGDSVFDIVSECHEEINDEELRKFIEDYAERMMRIHCREHDLNIPNHIIKDAFRIGFGDGFKKAIEL